MNHQGKVLSRDMDIETTVFVSCMPSFVESTVVLVSANDGDIPIIATKTNNPAKMPIFVFIKKLFLQ